MNPMYPGTKLKKPTNVFQVAIPATLVLGLGVGTGGACTFDYLRVLDAKLVLNSQRGITEPSDSSISVATAARDLSFIRSVLKIGTSDLARTLGVSRQAIYNWKAGSFIKAENLSKLDNLREAANVFVQARLTVTSQMLDRKLDGGKTFLELLGSGASGSATAAMLLNLVSQEAEDRRSLDELLAGNTLRPSGNYGRPALSEG